MAKYITHELPTERTFVMIKPDGVMRGLIGEIIKRFEQRGLKILAMKMMCACRDQVDTHYPKNPEWVERLGQRAVETFKEYDMDIMDNLGSEDPKVIGANIRSALLDYVTMGPVVPMVIEGVHAIAVVRKLVGKTLPIYAEPGTIRGDFSHDAPTSANIENRSIFNIIHASETVEEAEKEIAHWFSEEDCCDYDRSDHVIMFGDKR